MGQRNEMAARPTDRMRSALRVLATDVVGDPVAERITWALIASASGHPAPLSFAGDELAAAVDFAEAHRIRSAVNRLAPGAGGDTLQALASAVTMDRHLLEVLDLFDTRSIRVAVLKGNATARLDHRHHGDRESGDIDLLVHPSDLRRSMSALADAGHRHIVTHPFRTPEFFHSETFRHPEGSEIDLHHRLAQASRTPTSCWQSLETFDLGGRVVAALPRSWRFLHALVHQMMNPPPSFRGVNGLLDLVAIWHTGIDLDDVRSAAAEIGLVATVERGLRRLGDLLDEGDPGAESAVVGRSNRIEQRLAVAMDSTSPVPGHLSFLSGLSAQPRRLWPRYVRELLWPTREYRELLGVSAVGQLRHIGREALGR